MESTKKNTLVFEFPKDAMGPSLFEMSRFGKKLTADRTMMDTCYRNADEKSIYIRFKTAEAFNDAVLYNGEIHTFEYNDGSTVQVKMAVAGGMYKYVRIFNLPPEVSDDDIGRVLARYGKIRKQVREKFPPECEFDVYSGIRGVYMDIQKPIPASLFIRNSKARIYYEGFKNRCFHCKADDHLKVNCPQLQEGQKGAAAELRKGNSSNEAGHTSYSDVAAGASSLLAQRLEQARKIESSEVIPHDDSNDPAKEADKPDDKAEAACKEGTSSTDDQQSTDMELERTTDEASNGTKRALRALRSTSDESNDEQERANKLKSLPKRQKNDSAGSSGNESILEVIQNLPKDKEAGKNGKDRTEWSTVTQKNPNGKRGGKR